MIMAVFRIVPIALDGDPIQCETCCRPVAKDGNRWQGQVEERGGFTDQCLDCLNVLARMADAVEDLQGPEGNPIRLNDQGDVEL